MGENDLSPVVREALNTQKIGVFLPIQAIFPKPEQRLGLRNWRLELRDFRINLLS